MDLGKKFETHLKANWASSVPDAFLYRLDDQMSGYQGSSNICDFIGYKYPNIYLIECKEHKKNTFPFSAFRQYDDLAKCTGIKGLHAGVVLWFSDHDLVLWIPIETFIKLKEEDKKSFNVKMVDDPEYECLVLPSRKLIRYMDTDYSALIEYYRSEDD